MDAIVNWLGKYVVPIAAKIGSIRWLMALRDAFIATLPITMTGALATVVNALITTYPVQWGWTGFVNGAQPVISICNTVANGSLAIFALFFAAMWGYYLSTAYKVDGIAGVLVSVSAFLMGINGTAKVVLTKSLGSSARKILTDAGVVVDQKSIAVNGAFSINNMGSASLFTAMIFGALALVIYIWLMKRHLVITMPDTVPPAVTQAFVSLIPAVGALFGVAIANYLFNLATGQVFGDWLSATIQEPLLHAGQSFGMVLLITFLIPLFWFFGIHGTSVLQPVMSSIWTTAQLSNMAALSAHKEIPYLWVRGSWDAYVNYGGDGGTIILIIVLLLFSKRADEKAVAKVALVPGIFEINEPILFSLPIVLNAVYLIPFLLVPMVNVTVAYWVTVAGWVAPVQIQVPWITPPILDAWMATNFDFRAILLTVFNMVVAFFIWLPFVILSSRMQKDQLEKEAAS